MDLFEQAFKGNSLGVAGAGEADSISARAIVGGGIVLALLAGVGVAALVDQARQRDLNPSVPLAPGSTSPMALMNPDVDPDSFNFMGY